MNDDTSHNIKMQSNKIGCNDKTAANHPHSLEQIHYSSLYSDENLKTQFKDCG
ncbi:hypothetical protein SynA1825c_01877 [Synechococcus sp. A18-25c]|nr:hypothetical protein SynA1560_01894 [Synechococcus sp. A15-60]QNJ20178.1 hypothetical protein SynA1825c_01877 [Synechococcus sp. A18-25c]